MGKITEYFDCVAKVGPTAAYSARTPKLNLHALNSARASAEKQSQFTMAEIITVAILPESVVVYAGG